MQKNFKEELEKLIEQAYQAGYIHACWSDGVPNVTNEIYFKSEGDLKAAVKQLLEKYNESR